MTIPIIKKNKEAAAQDLSGGFVVLINKETDWTSFDVVKKLRSFLKIKKVGHAGTLDPFATGLVVIGAGRATKRLQDFTELPKTYDALIRLGVATESYDRTGRITAEQDCSSITLKDIKQKLSKMQGTIRQIPPMFSAKRVNGVRLYKLARQEKTVERQPVTVQVYETQILEWQNPYLHLQWRVSKGTYIRSLAHDLGQMLGVGGHLQELTRTAIGQYALQNAMTIREFMQYWNELSSVYDGRH